MRRIVINCSVLLVAMLAEALPVLLATRWFGRAGLSFGLLFIVLLTVVTAIVGAERTIRIGHRQWTYAIFRLYVGPSDVDAAVVVSGSLLVRVAGNLWFCVGHLPWKKPQGAIPSVRFAVPDGRSLVVIRPRADERFGQSAAFVLLGPRKLLLRSRDDMVMGDDYLFSLFEGAVEVDADGNLVGAADLKSRSFPVSVYQRYPDGASCAEKEREQ